MGLSWLKKIGKGVIKGIAISAAFTDNKHLDFLNALIEGAQSAIKDKAGADKKVLVEAASDAALLAAVESGELSQAHADQIKAVRSRYIDLYVKTRNLEAETEATWDELQALAAELKKGTA